VCSKVEGEKGIDKSLPKRLKSSLEKCGLWRKIFRPPKKKHSDYVISFFFPFSLPFLKSLLHTQFSRFDVVCFPCNDVQCRRVKKKKENSENGEWSEVWNLGKDKIALMLCVLLCALCRQCIKFSVELLRWMGERVCWQSFIILFIISIRNVPVKR
jgi:hypothetical protein